VCNNVQNAKITKVFDTKDYWRQKVQKLIQKTIEKYAQKLESGKQIIRATIVEIVDFRVEDKKWADSVISTGLQYRF